MDPSTSSPAVTRVDQEASTVLGFSMAKMAGLFALICVLLFLRYPDPLIHPWTLVNEEGTVFFQDAYNLGFWQALFTPYAGYCTVAPRLVAFACKVLPYRSLPFAYSFLSLLVDAAVFSFFYLPHFRRIVERDWQRFAICLGLCAVPAYPLLRLEMIHFYLAILLALIVIMELPDRVWAKAVLAIAAIVSVWSAPSAIVLMPLYLYRCIRRGVSKAERIVWASVVLASAAYLVNVWAGRQNRMARIDLIQVPAELWHSFAYRVAGVGLAGEKWADWLVSTHGWYAVFPLLLVVIALSLILLNTDRKQGRPLLPVLVLLWGCVATSALIILRPDFSITYFVYDPKYPYWPNDRYFFPATVFLFLCLGILWSRQRGMIKSIANILVIGWCCSLYLWGYSFHYWKPWGPRFDPYCAQLEKTEREAAADGKIHKLIIPISASSWLVILDVGKRPHTTGPPQEVAPSTQKYTDFLDLDQDIPGHRNSKWFGEFDDSTYPWLHHKVYGWMACLGTTTGGFWFWTKDLESFWTAPWTFPKVFLAQKNDWVVLRPDPEPGATPPK